jgi:hypothetical protein
LSSIAVVNSRVGTVFSPWLVSIGSEISLTSFQIAISLLEAIDIGFRRVIMTTPSETGLLDCAGNQPGMIQDTQEVLTFCCSLIDLTGKPEKVSFGGFCLQTNSFWGLPKLPRLTT